MGPNGIQIGVGIPFGTALAQRSEKVEMLSSRGGQGEPQGAPIQPNGVPKARQGCQKGAQREPSGSHFHIFVCHSFWLRFSIVFWMVLESFWEVFCIILGCHLGIVSDIEKKARPHERGLNSSQIEGRAPWKTIENHSKVNGKRLTGVSGQIV